MEEFLARKYLWIDKKAWLFFFTILVKGVGRIVKTVRNATVKTTVKKQTKKLLFNGCAMERNFILSTTVLYCILLYIRYFPWAFNVSLSVQYFLILNVAWNLQLILQLYLTPKEYHLAPTPIPAAGSVTYWFYLPNSHSYLPVPHIYYYPLYTSAAFLLSGLAKVAAGSPTSGPTVLAKKDAHLIPATHCITADNTRLHAGVWKTNKNNNKKTKQI